MTIYSLLSTETVLHDLDVKDKEDLLNQLIDLLGEQVTPDQLTSIREAVFVRESIMSTGVGKGLAIPHGKVPGIEESYASFALLREPIDYDSIDKEPVQIAFLLVGPESKNTTHIKLLSRISRLMNSRQFREQLLDCESSDEIYEHFRQKEAQYFDS